MGKLTMGWIQFNCSNKIITLAHLGILKKTETQQYCKHVENKYTEDLEADTRKSQSGLCKETKWTIIFSICLCLYTQQLKEYQFCRLSAL